MREREGQAGTTTHLRCAGRCRASFRLSCFFPSVFWTSWRAGASRHEVPAACRPGSRSFHFFHVSLFRNYRTLSIALRCFNSFSFRILMSFHVFSRTFLSIMFRLAPPRMFRHFLEFSSVFVLLVYRLVLFLYFLLLPRALARGASPRAAAWGVAGQQALWGRVVGVTPPL